MKHLKLFQTDLEYQEHMNSGESVTPNCYLIKENNEIKYNAINLATIPLYIEALEDISVSFSAFKTGMGIWYSLDQKEWISLGNNVSTPIVAKGQKIYFKADGNSYKATNGIGIFSISGLCNVGGNAVSMLYGDDFFDHPEGCAFRRMFYGQRIVDAKDLILPATILTGDCYSDMFGTCADLISAPKLPAEELSCRTVSQYEVYGCYYSMFADCTSLVNAPELPAKTLKNYCYGFMFRGCTNLAYIKMLAVDLATSSLLNWVEGVASSGVFVKNSSANWSTTGASGVPSGWTVETAEA